MIKKIKHNGQIHDSQFLYDEYLIIIDEIKIDNFIQE